MRSKKSYFYIALFCIHCFIAIVAFLHFRLHPHDILFTDYGDGLKNIFTLSTYVKAPITADGLLKSDAFLYPFGDYVYYLDNTPLFAIPFRFFCQHIYDLSSYTVIIFYIVIILNILLCGLLIYYLLRQLAGDNIISCIMAVLLPWVNMQVGRIFVGHYAFSFSSLILLCLCLMVLWHRHIHNRENYTSLRHVCACCRFFHSLPRDIIWPLLPFFQSSMCSFMAFPAAISRRALQHNHVHSVLAG